ncbi:MAG: hypothetical protein Q9M91_01375 [Candidatus Dojkabacteria bacterium]|nr:hypothetical protein [Candidatus Dojkabacteria bacterium]
MSPVAFHSTLKDHKLLKLGSFLERFHIPISELVIKIGVKRLFKYSYKELKENVNDQVLDFSMDLVKKGDPKTMFSSVEELFNTELSETIKEVKDKYKFLIVNSKSEWKFFRRQSEHLRYLLDDEDSLKIEGKHKDFLIKPRSKTVESVMDFLTK